MLLVLLMVGISTTTLAFLAARFGLRRYVGFRRLFLGRTARDLDYLYSNMQADRVLIMTILGMIVLGVAGVLLNVTLIPTVALMASGYFIPRGVIELLRRRRSRRFEGQLVDAIAMISSSLRIGLNLHHAIRTVVNEMESPISQEFGLVLRETQLGASLEESVQRLARRIGSEDLDLMVAAITVAHQTGGDLGQIFSNIAEQIRERKRLQGKVESMTTAGRLQGAVVASVPPLLFFWTFVSDPERFADHYASVNGMLMLAVVMGLYGLAFVTIRRIVQVSS